jgi:hypothetical protein
MRRYPAHTRQRAQRCFAEFEPLALLDETASHDVLWRLLEVTHALGGAATDEQPARRRGTGYRGGPPLRDDKRIQLSVRRLRTLIEEDASRPQRWVTTPHGDLFGDAEDVRVAR